MGSHDFLNLINIFDYVQNYLLHHSASKQWFITLSNGFRNFGRNNSFRNTPIRIITILVILAKLLLMFIWIKYTQSL